MIDIDINLASFYGTQAKSADPDQTPHSVVSDQDIHCFFYRMFY